jgi:secreted Zn-dependent insulinase-like peptidase
VTWLWIQPLLSASGRNRLSDVSQIPSQVCAEALSQIMEQPFYDTLRTQQQLGYIVFSGDAALLCAALGHLVCTMRHGGY